MKDRIICGDCQKVMREVADESVDLIFTSPPYADARRGRYLGVHPDKYLEWFLPKARQFFRVLKKMGSFALNINDVTRYGETHLYVHKLIIALKRDVGFRFIDPFIWVKPSPPPDNFKGRFKDAKEYILHFTKGFNYTFNWQAIAEPMKPQSIARILSEKQTGAKKSATGSGFTRRGYCSNIRARIARGEPLIARPSNVIIMPGISYNTGHPAAMNPKLAEWFIKLLSNEGDLVLDPFCGIGTTCFVAKKLGRHYLGIDICFEYCKKARRNLKRVEKEECWSGWNERREGLSMGFRMTPRICKRMKSGWTRELCEYCTAKDICKREKIGNKAKTGR